MNSKLLVGKNQCLALYQGAKRHKEQGNDLLAKWFLESAKYVEEIDKRTQRALDKMPLGNYQKKPTRKDRFVSQWLKLEDEYFDNWDRN